MKDVVEHSIDNFSYSITQMGVDHSLETMKFLLQVMGPSLGTVIEGYDPKKNFLEQDLSKVDLSKALMQVTTSMKAGDFSTFCRDMCAYVLLNGKGGGKLAGETYEAHFSGAKNMPRLFKLMTKILQVNYGNFFEDLVGGSLQGLMASQSTQEDSTGSSGESGPVVRPA